MGLQGQTWVRGTFLQRGNLGIGYQIPKHKEKGEEWNYLERQPVPQHAESEPKWSEEGRPSFNQVIKVSIIIGQIGIRLYLIGYSEKKSLTVTSEVSC